MNFIYKFQIQSQETGRDICGMRPASSPSVIDELLFIRISYLGYLLLYVSKCPSKAFSENSELKLLTLTLARTLAKLLFGDCQIRSKSN
jgi:hypothetical protein